MEPFVEDNLIFMVIAGSNMYGMSTPESDIDKRGVCVPPMNVVLGFAKNFEQQDYSNEDTVVFSLAKFMKLAADCNPNIIELLFAPEESIVKTSPLWEELRKRRFEFLSAKAYHTFTGYATGQLKRIRTHRSWLLHPPTHKPTREEFGLEGRGQGVRELSKGVDVAEIDTDVIRVIEKEKRFKSALTQWNQYQTWKKNRNPKRSALEAKYGYDTKHASHLVRLLRMGKEILTTGDLTVRRPDAEELLAIRHGKWTYDELMENIQPLWEELEQIYNDRSYKVPHKVNKNALSDLCAELHVRFWNTFAT
jgi:predicted nucleotidyltransferase